MAVGIVASGIVALRDLGSSWFVEELHTDNVGLSWAWNYVPSKSVDLGAKLVEHATTISDQLIDGEVSRCIRDNVLSAVYLTKSELAAIIRELYRTGDRDLILRIARWIRARIVAGDFTETQVRNAFGMDQASWDALKVRLQSYDEALSVLESAAGE